MAKRKTNLIRPPDFKTVYAIGAVGSWTPYDFRLNFYSEEVHDDNGDALMNDVQIVLSPKAARDLTQFLVRSVKDYDHTYREDDKLTRTQQSTDTGRGETIRAQDKEIRKDLKTDLKRDLKKDLKADLRKDLRRDLKTTLEKDLRKDLRTTLVGDLRKDLAKDLRKQQQRDAKRAQKEEQQPKESKKDTKTDQKRGRKGQREQKKDDKKDGKKK